MSMLQQGPSGPAMNCARCGAESPPGSRFCNTCGTAMSGSVTVGTAPAQPSGGGERRRATVLFADLTGFTTLGEQRDPEEVRELMGRVFGEAARVITGYGGVVEKYIGDAVMAVFGSNQASEDDALRAVRSARQIRQYVRALNAEYAQQAPKPLDVHSGINTGLIVTGQIGAQAGTMGVVGDTVNLAARLSDVAEPGEILLGSETALQIERLFHTEELAPLTIKGKANAVRAYRLGDPRERPAATRRLAGVHAAMVGREVESGLLKRALDRLRDGKGSILALRGEAGSGKSRLVEEFRSGLPQHFRWLSGVAYDHTRGIPYQPVIDMLGRVWNIQESDSPAAVRQKVEAGCRQSLSEPDGHVPYLGTLYALEYPQLAGVAPEYRQNKLEEALLALFEGFARQGPTVFFLEDLHWADPSTVSLVRRLLSNFKVPAIVLCAYRPPFQLFAPDVQVEGYRETDLEALSTPQVQDLVTALLGGEVPAQLMQFVLERAAGNPFFVEELLNALIDLKVLQKADVRTDQPTESAWSLVGDLSRVDLPGTVQGVIAARLDRVDVPSKRLLQEASVIGQRFFFEVLRRITTVSEELQPKLEGLQVQDLIRAAAAEPDLEYLFKHPLTQEVVYQSLLLRERKQIHERVGQAIEAVLADRLPEFYERLAFHFLNGASRLKAVDYLNKAGTKAVARFALKEANDYFRRGYELITAERDGSDEERTLLFKLLDQWGKVHYYNGTFGSWLEILDRHISEVEQVQDPAAQAMFHAWRGISLFFSSPMDQSELALRKALALAETSGNTRALTYACTWLSMTCALVSKFDEGVVLGQRAHELCEAIQDDDYVAFKSLTAVTFSYWQRGEASKTLEFAARVIELGIKMGNPRSLVMGYWLLSLGHLEGGDLPAALVAAGKAESASKDPFYSQLGTYSSGITKVLNGISDLALTQLLPSFRKENEFLLHSTTGFVGVRLIIDGRMAEGMKLIDQSIQWFEEVRDVQTAEFVKFVKGKVYLNIATGPKPPLGVMLRNAAFILRHAPVAGKRAEHLFSSAATHFGAIGATGRRAQALLDLGTLYRHQRRKSEARQCLKEAVEIFERVGATAFLQQARHGLAEVSTA